MDAGYCGLLPGLVAAAILIACADTTRRDETAASSVPAVHDSAGVRIILNPQHAPDSTSWTIDTTPMLVIGDDAKGREYAFASVTGVVRLTTGSIVIADGRPAREIRLFDSAGTFVRSIGRVGQGPGEFTGVMGLVLLPDNRFLALPAYTGRHPVVFDTTGRNGRTVAPPPSFPGDSGRYDEPSIEAFFTDGTALARTGLVAPWPRATGDWRKPMPVMSTTRLLRVVPSGPVLADYGDHARQRAWRYARVAAAPAGRSSRGNETGFQYTRADLPGVRWAISGMDLYISHGAAFEVRVHDATGRLARIVRKHHTRYAIPQAWIDSQWNAVLGSRLPAEVAWLTAAEPPAPTAHAPATDAMIIDRLGNVWLRTSPLGDSEPPSWFVFDTAGVLRHSLRSRLDIRQVEADRVVGVLRDSLQVERVAVFELRKRS